ncbi:MAG: beta-ketoacyl synthase chain length factor [Gammaproteobacteria bacterium]
MQQSFVVVKWAVWPPLQVDAERERVEQERLLAVVPKMLKRRLSALARTVFCAANQCIDGNDRLPAVFSSTHGELAKSFAMMEMIEAGEEISPTAFSLSVHNAVAGLFSMAWRNTLQTTVVAPGQDGMAPAFIEALGVLTEGVREVLVVFYDEPIVPFYPTEPYRLATDQRCALALRLAATGPGLSINMAPSPQTGDDGEQSWQLPAFVRFLNESDASLLLKNPKQSWRFEKYVNAA